MIGVTGITVRLEAGEVFAAQRLNLDMESLTREAGRRGISEIWRFLTPVDSATAPARVSYTLSRSQRRSKALRPPIAPRVDCRKCPCGHPAESYNRNRFAAF
jgi:hypothetical protein